MRLLQEQSLWPYWETSVQFSVVFLPLLLIQWCCCRWFVRVEMVYQILFPLENPELTIVTPRLILTEGIFTGLLGIFTYFFLPDCRLAFPLFSAGHDWPFLQFLQLHPNYLRKKRLSPKPAFQVTLLGLQRRILICASLLWIWRTNESGCFSSAGPFHCWHDRAYILPANCHSKPWVYVSHFGIKEGWGNLLINVKGLSVEPSC